MITILVAILLLTDIIKYFIIFDVILSWLILIGLRFRPKFIANIMDPIYKKVKEIIPTTFGMLDFTPIIIIFILLFIQAIIFSFDPSIQQYYFDITNL
ncbi:MAG: YggT family protein [Candidatus Gracilibacteria bacterium]|nr:YggT family protein [Candidatus Gracilibacteria bacterium]